MKAKDNQRGAALIVTLVLLVVALLLGISSFQSSRLDEGMAGNYRASSAAFMAAEYGGSELWETFISPGVDRTTECDGAFGNFSDITLGDSGTQLSLKYRYTCSPEFDEVTEVEKFGRYQLVSTGRVVQEVPVDRHILYAARLGIGPGAPLVAADTAPDCKSTVNLPSSNADFEGDEDVDGNFRAALQVGCTGLAESTADSVLNGQQTYVVDGETYTCDATQSGNKLCNYKGGIQGGIDIEILKNPELLAEFLRAVRQDGNENIDDPVKVRNVFPSSADFDADGGSVYFLEPSSDHTDFDEYGRANFVEGGNFSGKGILIVDGNVNLQGVPNFEGLIIVLGDYIVDGGGGAAQGEFKGSVVAAPVDWDFEAEVDGVAVDYRTAEGNEYESCSDPCGYTFAPKTLEIGGGGDSSYIFDDEALLSAFDLIDHVVLDDGRNVTDLWGVDGQNLGDRYYISEWQEIFDIGSTGLEGGG